MDREPMTDKERDDALIAEKKRLAYFLECKEGTLEAEAMFRRAAALLRGDEQPKPDRAEVLAEEIWPYLRSLSRDRLVPILNRHFDELRAEWEAERLTNAAYGNVKNEDWYYQCYQNLVRLLRRHFAPPSVVVEAAEMVQRLSEGATAGTYYASAKAIADFILKGDQ